MVPVSKTTTFISVFTVGAVLAFILWSRRKGRAKSGLCVSSSKASEEEDKSQRQRSQGTSGSGELDDAAEERSCDEEKGTSKTTKDHWNGGVIEEEPTEAGEKMPLSGERVSVGRQGGGAGARCTESSSEDETIQDDMGMPASDACKVFVSNISFSARTRELRDFFEFFGKVSRVHLLKDRNRKRSRGMAFITFSSAQAAERARRGNKYELTLDGRVMRCNALERRSRRKSQLVEPKKTNPGDKTSCSASSGGKVRPPPRMGDGSGETEDMMVADDDSLINAILPDDILMTIFSYLGLKDRIRMEFVCKRWQSVCLSLWCSQRSLHFNNVFKGLLFSEEGVVALNDSIFKSILNKGCQNLRYLDVSASPRFLTTRSMNYIGHICKELRYLNLSSTKVDNTSIRTLTDGCRKIETIILKRCNEIGEKGIWWMFHNCENLTHIDLEDCRRVNGKCFHILNKYCKTVRVAGCSSITDKGLGCLTNKCGDSLEELDISGCMLVTDVGFTSVTQKCVKLKFLSFCCLHSNVTSYGLQSVSDLPCLQTLHLSKHQSVDDAALNKIGLHCKGLRELKIDGCSFPDVTDAGVRSLTRCPHLEILNISYLGKVTNEGLKPIALTGRLRKLVTRSLPLTDEAIQMLATHCTRLYELDVCGCCSLTVASIQAFLETRQTLAEASRAETLTLNFGGTAVTEEALSELGEIDSTVSVCLMNLTAPPGSYYPAILPLADEDDWDKSSTEDEDDEEGLGENEAGRDAENRIGPRQAPWQPEVFPYNFREQGDIEYLQAPADSDEPWDRVLNQEPTGGHVVGGQDPPQGLDDGAQGHLFFNQSAADYDRALNPEPADAQRTDPVVARPGQYAIANPEQVLNPEPACRQKTDPVVARPGHYANANPELAQFVDVEEDLMDVAYGDEYEWGMGEEEAEDFLDADDPAYLNDLLF